MEVILSLTSGSLFQPSLPKLKVTIPCATWPSWETCTDWLARIGVPSGAFAGTAPSICWIWSSWVRIVARSARVSPEAFW